VLDAVFAHQTININVGENADEKSKSGGIALGVKQGKIPEFELSIKRSRFLNAQSNEMDPSGLEHELKRPRWPKY
jgi:hypothetical protein